ncbi:MAG: glycosyltransferase family 2 protein, partial [Eubacteriales bacterium]|nr:glycosyltransferase family 2 protein [Eubacteriales bacterium]
MKRMSIVVPCYNEEAVIPLFYEACAKTMAELPVEAEWWFVDDGSADGTLTALKALRQKDERAHYISFSRNFGKESAMYAGLEAATGDYVAVMDVDLQDPPSLLPKMLSALETEGYDCVATRRVTRAGEPMLRSFFARKFYRLINRISKTEVVDGARDYRLMTRQMVNAILSLKEVSRFS